MEYDCTIELRVAGCITISADTPALARHIAVHFGDPFLGLLPVARRREALFTVLNIVPVIAG